MCYCAARQSTSLVDNLHLTNRDKNKGNEQIQQLNDFFPACTGTGETSLRARATRSNYFWPSRLHTYSPATHVLITVLNNTYALGMRESPFRLLRAACCRAPRNVCKQHQQSVESTRMDVLRANREAVHLQASPTRRQDGQFSGFKIRRWTQREGKVVQMPRYTNKHQTRWNGASLNIFQWTNYNKWSRMKRW